MSFPLLAIEINPGLSWERLGWNSVKKGLPKIDSPPVPVPVGSPPYKQKSCTNLWNLVPS